MSNALTSQTASELLGNISITDFNAAQGHVSFKGHGSTSDKDGPYNFSAAGIYDEAHIRLDLHAEGVTDGDRLEVSGTIVGTAGPACPRR